jgi:hypothetical protein
MKRYYLLQVNMTNYNPLSSITSEYDQLSPVISNMTHLNPLQVNITNYDPLSSITSEYDQL